MAELRWILLLAGLVFLAGLAAWELRRPRQGRRDVLGPTGRSEPQLGHLSDFAPTASPSHGEMPPLGSPLVISLDAPIQPPTLQPVAPAPEESAQAVEDQPPPAMEAGEIVVPMLPAAEPMIPIVDWPPEEQRHIISVRVVGLNPERLLG